MAFLQITSRAGSDLSLSKQNSGKPSLQFWLLAAFLLLVFLCGGASRIDVQSLLILRPASILVCALAAMTLTREQIRRHRGLLAAATVLFLLAALHLIPLPPALWQSLPGREAAIAIDALAGLNEVWRPLTLTPMNGWHALVALFAPLAVLLLGIQLGKEDRYRLLPLVLGLGALSGLIGLLQVIGNPRGPLYFYRITNHGAAVGLFANRNHAATLLACLFPMLAVYASAAKATVDQQNSRQLQAAAMAIVLVPLILVTGSRAGLVTAGLGLLAAPLLFRRPAPGRKLRRENAGFKIGARPILATMALLSVGFLTIFFARAEAIERLFAPSSPDDNRLDFWRVSIAMFRDYFPFGSGSGSYVEAFQIVEPNRILDATYLNHAHNDWVEIAVTFGLPGVLLMLVAVFLYTRRTYRLWRSGDGTRRSIAFGRMAGVAMALIGIASMTDYPLRTPIIACLFAILLLWFVDAGDEPAGAPAARTEA